MLSAGTFPAPACAPPEPLFTHGARPSDRCARGRVLCGNLYERSPKAPQSARNAAKSAQGRRRSPWAVLAALSGAMKFIGVLSGSVVAHVPKQQAVRACAVGVAYDALRC